MFKTTEELRKEVIKDLGAVNIFDVGIVGLTFEPSDKVVGNHTKKGIAFIDKKQSGAYPVIYVDDFLDEVNERVMTTMEVAKHLLYIYQNECLSAQEIFNRNSIVNMVSSWDNLKEHVNMRLINTDNNREMLKNLPHFDFYDLSCIFYIQVNENMESKITNELLKELKIDEYILAEQARKNTIKAGFKIDGLAELAADAMAKDLGMPSQMVEDLFGEEIQNEQAFVYRTAKEFDGSIVLLFPSLFKTQANKFQENLILTPSSIHEVIAYPESVGNMEVITDRNIIDTEEILTTNLYYYDRELNNIRLLKKQS